ncbi:hypothetical protein EVA_15273 [gut metagenome]|uniref:Uncharacterized protein n=1 Tax=gut metagenome TaxID=749906 RepID=J9FNX0_9ZZZZ
MVGNNNQKKTGIDKFFGSFKNSGNPFKFIPRMNISSVKVYDAISIKKCGFFHYASTVGKA